MTRPTITIGVQPNTKLLRIERVVSRWVDTAYGSLNTEVRDGGAWMVWINSNIDFTLGTYILLHDDGRIERVTSHPDGTEDVFTVKEEGD